ARLPLTQGPLPRAGGPRSNRPAGERRIESNAWRALPGAHGPSASIVTRCLRFAASGRGVVLAAAFLALLFLIPTVRLVHYIYFTRGGRPDLERFIRFEIPTIGAVYDSHGTVLVELAREYRRVVSYDDVPPVLRDAILAAEDRKFLTHSRLEYRALPPRGYKQN